MKQFAALTALLIYAHGAFAIIGPDGAGRWGLHDDRPRSYTPPPPPPDFNRIKKDIEGALTTIFPNFGRLQYPGLDDSLMIFVFSALRRDQISLNDLTSLRLVERSELPIGKQFMLVNGRPKFRMWRELAEHPYGRIALMRLIARAQVRKQLSFAKLIGHLGAKRTSDKVLDAKAAKATNAFLKRSVPADEREAWFWQAYERFEASTAWFKQISPRQRADCASSLLREKLEQIDIRDNSLAIELEASLADSPEFRAKLAARARWLRVNE